MAKMDEVQTMATLSLARQQQTDMRVDAVEQTANEAKALATGAAAGEPAGNVDLAGLAGWAPKALSAWKLTDGGGSCAVCVPDGCVSYAGSTVPAAKFHPGVETKLGLRYCTVPPAEGGQGGKLFLTVTVPTSGGSEGEVDGVYIEWAASESAARNAHSSGSVDIVACVLLVETVNGELQQRHTGNVILGTTGEQQGLEPDEVSVDYRTAVDGQGNPRTHRETVDGVETDVPEKTDELEVKGWHEDDPVVGSSLAELMGFPVSGEPSNDVIVRDGGKGGPLRYYKVGQVDPSQMPINPCRVVSISDGTSQAGNTPPKIYDLVYTGQNVTVDYARDGNCEDGDDLRFTIPIVGPAGVTEEFEVVTAVDYRLDQDGVRRLYATERTLKFTSGVLTGIGKSFERLLAETIKHSQVYPSGT